MSKVKVILNFVYALFLAVLIAALFAASDISAQEVGVDLQGVMASPGTTATEQTEPAVTLPPAEIAISKAELSLNLGESFILTAAVSPSGYSAEQLVWGSSDGNVARVDSNGRVDALAPGVAVITAGIGGNNSVCNVTVYPEIISEKAEITSAYKANSDILDDNLKNKSKNPYYIKINKKQNCVTVYTYGEDGEYTVPVRAMVCSTGADTPIGTFGTGYNASWNYLFGDVWGQYATGIYGNILFHSVPYKTNSPDSLKYDYYNQLGTEASMGCIRLAVADCKWVYDNCRENTTVEIFNSDSLSSLGKPPAIKLPEGSGWDPTDVGEPGNPWNKAHPTISGADTLHIKSGDEFDPLAGVSATDTCGNNITGRIAVFGSVLTGKPGVYRLTYSVSDVIHKFAKVERIVYVD